MFRRPVLVEIMRAGVQEAMRHNELEAGEMDTHSGNRPPAGPGPHAPARRRRRADFDGSQGGAVVTGLRRALEAANPLAFWAQGAQLG
jgi:hypothetical protein